MLRLHLNAADDYDRGYGSSYNTELGRGYYSSSASASASAGGRRHLLSSYYSYHNYQDASAASAAASATGGDASAAATAASSGERSASVTQCEMCVSVRVTTALIIAGRSTLV